MLLYAFDKSEPPKHRLESEWPAAWLHTIAHVRYRAPTLVIGHLFVCRPWIWQIALAVQRRIHSCIIAIDIVEARERAVVVYAERKIGDVDGDLLVECNVVIAPRVEGRFDPRRTPTLVMPQDNLGEPLGILYAHAAMALGAHGIIEQGFLRGVVHVDVVLVGEQELHAAQHVVWSRRLDEIEIADVVAAPIDLIGIDIAIAVFYAQAVTLEHRGVPGAAEEAATVPHIGRDHLHLDGVGDIPIGVEDDLFHLV